MTALEPDELLVEIEVPAPAAGTRMGFAEHTRTHGDFAVAGAAAVLAPGRATLALLGAALVPVLATAASAAEAAALAVANVEDPYRRALLTELTRRAIGAAT
jgi:CO/xanthine dehydrogenase FAD-binding subunit